MNSVLTKLEVDVWIHDKSGQIKHTQATIMVVCGPIGFVHGLENCNLIWIINLNNKQSPVGVYTRYSDLVLDYITQQFIYMLTLWCMVTYVLEKQIVTT